MRLSLWAKFQKACKSTLKTILKDRLPKEDDDNANVLITPMGASVGLLYTALKKVKADKVIVLTSEKFKDRVLEVCKAADDFDYNKVYTVIIKDAFCGFDEAKDLSKNIFSKIKNAGNYKVNLTGGTTAMQWAMQTVYEELKKNYKSVTRIAFVDRRSAVEQQSNPFVEGELIEIEKLVSKDKSE